ncbi:LysR substrate-binding domain-containing protein [Acidocella aminolytica]|jgi:LysR family glycine cleavage system transcriptional activator|uniref:Transcriptional regulator LysR n=1 Tax=Acidocella aminolytica 101 = DSM 11237 TaxID=1120923 RepID=A0A0D6PHD4_9PROT|nr:LysR substrate-binding domain-containing protein [Acidocella aminolytica]GAN81092.1 transcriptional regulator LysR [Acidocella aminolytica 101 = DSM 11237]GBQ40304.1 transcriptional regulator [Acidocella aminolytica 101 = DSM 11237]SHF61050.1 LysR family transcriptional regulator, glycine cleavage system transcriptional activator [Acidocella aminolytica 101 = DSM 11237]
MKRGRLPLTALRSFEAAGRHQSFTLAAEELFVSQAAISRQIRELEEMLGHDLFVRRHRQVVLTERGQTLLNLLTESFDDISRILEDIRAAPPDKPLQISVEPSFAACWLIPRLNRFRETYPDIEVMIVSEARMIEFRAGEAEIGIRWSGSASSWPRMQAALLVKAVMSPVLSPTLLPQDGTPLTPSDLLALPLLHEEKRSYWQQWFVAAGLPDVPPQPGPLFAGTSLALDAAARGHGVALGDNVLVEDMLRIGDLVQPFETSIPCGAYWLVAPNFDRLSPAAKVFSDWLKAEFA